MSYTELSCLKNEVSILHNHAVRCKALVIHHFKNRHDGRGNAIAKAWIKDYRNYLRADSRARIAEIEAGSPQKNWCTNTGRWI